MLRGKLRRRLIKASALILAGLLGAFLTTGLAQFTTGMIVDLDTGSVGQTIVRNLEAYKSDIRLIAEGTDPSKEFKQTLTRAIAGEAISGYQLFDTNGTEKFRSDGLDTKNGAFKGEAVRAAASGKLETQSGWNKRNGASRYISYAFVPLEYNGKTIAVHVVHLDQTERWNRYFNRLLLLMWIASFVAVCSVGFPVLLWYQKNRALINQEDEMHQLLARFEAAFDNMPQGVTLFDRDSKLVIANEQYLKFYNLNREIVKQGMSLEEVRRHRLACGAPESLLDVYEKPKTDTIDQYQPAKKWHLDDGRSIETQRYLVPGGGWVTIHTDITDRMAREAEINGARNFLNSVIEHMPGAVIVKNPENLQYILINKQVEHVVGLPREAIIGKSAPDFFAPDQAEMINHRDLLVLADPDASVHDAEQNVETPGNGLRKIATKRIVVRDSSNVPAYLITMTEDVTDKRKAEDKILFLARHDALTGLYNRGYFHEQLEHYLAKPDESGELALILVDLDGFKEVNDTFGHPAGDEVLRVAAQRLRDIFCELDLIARLGGDEFAILCRSASCHLELQGLAQRIINDIQQPVEFEGRQIKVGATAGLAITPPDSIDAATILRYVDVAMYEAKDAGKGSFCFFDLKMMIKRLQRKQLEADMVDAISRDEFELHYQPIIDPRTSSIRSLEALLRWNHPERGTISPVEFIPVAEETGLIVPIGEHVLEVACNAARNWPQDIRISVNLSPVQFRDRNLAKKVLDILRRTDMAPKRLELEITEAALLQENEDNMTILDELRTTGVRIVMDDFGTGYSSLNYLRSFPFDKIKIDRSYIKDLVTENGNSLTIVQAVLALAAGLSLSTTAEGVETQEQLDILNAAGCDEIQGYFFSRPIPAADVPELISRYVLTAVKAA